MGWWLSTEHVAGFEHGFLGTTQGLIQSWLRQASLDEQSSSSSQPASGSGSTKIMIIWLKKMVIAYRKL